MSEWLFWRAFCQPCDVTIKPKEGTNWVAITWSFLVEMFYRKGMYREDRKLQVHDSSIYVGQSVYTPVYKNFTKVSCNMTQYSTQRKDFHYEVHSCICYFTEKEKQIFYG